VGAVLPIHVIDVNQSQIRLVNQGRGLHAAPRPLVAHEVAGDAAELCVNAGRELVERTCVAGRPGAKQLRGF